MYNFRKHYPRIDFQPIVGGKPVRYIREYVDAFEAGLKDRETTVVHIRTAREILEHKEKLQKRGIKPPHNAADYQILLDTETLALVKDQDMEVGKNYYLVTKTKRGKNEYYQVRYLFIVTGESVSSLGVDMSRSFAGEKRAAPDGVRVIIDAAMAAFLPPSK